MSVKIREKPPGSGEWWTFIDHRGQRKAKKIGDEKTAREVAKKILTPMAKQNVEKIDLIIWHLQRIKRAMMLADDKREALEQVALAI